jgi:hypothetical protein
MLADAEVTVATEENRYLANDRVIELWSASETVRSGMTGSGSRHCMGEATRLTVEQDIDVEMCFRSDVLPSRDHLDNADSDEFFNVIDAYRADDVPFTFLLFDDRAGIVGHNDMGTPMVIADTDDPGVYQWLEGRYTELKRGAEPVGRTKQLAD